MLQALTLDLFLGSLNPLLRPWYYAMSARGLPLPTIVSELTLMNKESSKPNTMGTNSAPLSLAMWQDAHLMCDFYSLFELTSQPSITFQAHTRFERKHDAWVFYTYAISDPNVWVRGRCCANSVEVLDSQNRRNAHSCVGAIVQGNILRLTDALNCEFLAEVPLPCL